MVVFEVEGGLAPAGQIGRLSSDARGRFRMSNEVIAYVRDLFVGQPIASVAGARRLE
jgi:hypothetical protein